MIFRLLFTGIFLLSIGCPGTSESKPTGVFPDPAPDVTTAGSYTCTGCPNSELPHDTLSLEQATSWTFSGSVQDAAGNGQFYVVLADGSRSLGGAIETNEDGSFEFTAPLFCGTQLVKCVWSNSAGSYVLATEVVVSDCVEPDIRATLSWDGLGQDFELHLIREGGSINDPESDCTWTTCIGSGPDWGTIGDDSDNPLKDVDNTGTYGPENIFLANPASGTYTVMVEHWGEGEPEAKGAVTLYAGDNGMRIVLPALAPKHVSTVATISWPAGVITQIDERHDCSATWESGCQASIP